MGNLNSGRRPQSAALRALRGNPSRTRPHADRLPPPGPVEKPATLSPGAAEVWDRLSPVCLGMGTLSPADTMAFATLCELQASFTANAQRKGRRGFDAGQERALAASLRPFYALFGLEPASRSRVALAPRDQATVSKWAGALA
jgi:phage terminase small subunit